MNGHPIKADDCALEREAIIAESKAPAPTRAALGNLGKTYGGETVTVCADCGVELRETPPHCACHKAVKTCARCGHTADQKCYCPCHEKKPTQLPMFEQPAPTPEQPPLKDDEGYLKAVFGPEGAFARTFSGYEMRRGQVRLTTAIDRAFKKGEHLIAEGPCGTGKSMAYLVPAVHHAYRGPIVVVTANIALQEQLVAKDLPLLEKVLGRKLNYVLIKGKQNYLCPERFQEWCDEAKMFGSEEDEIIKAWGNETETGDITELGRRLNAEPDPKTWVKICGDKDECDHCKDNECFAYKARAKAGEAQIIICNYHVLFSHIQLRQQTGQNLVLPGGLGYVICDEGHEMADIAREFARVQISSRHVSSLAPVLLKRYDEDLYDRYHETATTFFRDVVSYARSEDYKHIIDSPDFADVGPLLAALKAVREVWKKVSGGKNMSKSEAKTMKRRITRCNLAVEALTKISKLDGDEYVYWIEGHEDEDGRGRRRGPAAEPNIRICGKPKDVADYLDRNLFGEARSVVITSATLATDGGFKFLKRELGVRCEAMAVESPFDFKKQALLVVPRMRSAPGEREFPEEMADELDMLLEDTRGRALGLFTSYKNMRDVRALLDDNKFHILMQGEKPKGQLVEEFMATPNAVLLGTKSFWTGVDIPGEALTCLFIDKLPFPPPSDPIIAAYENDGDCDVFKDQSLPRAIMALRQGFGRLIRSKTDVGVVVIFDSRLVEKGYGETMIRSLPECTVTRNMDKVYDFLKKHGAS